MKSHFSMKAVLFVMVLKKKTLPASGCATVWWLDWYTSCWFVQNVFVCEVFTNYHWWL